MAFDERMYEINRSLKKYEGYVIFVFNLNNLKGKFNFKPF